MLGRFQWQVCVCHCYKLRDTQSHCELAYVHGLHQTNITHDTQLAK